MRIITTDIVSHEGKEVELMGWVSARRDHGKLIFIDLRDRSGICQLVFSSKELHEAADRLRPEWVVAVTGTVQRRPSNMENPALPTGKCEISVNKLTIISEAQTPPIEVESDGYGIGEEVRMKYRYLDLRRPRLARNLRMRAKALQLMRAFLHERDFVEVETPVLGKSTPEGARDYLVPSRLHAGQFYALPQSPQQYKQLLMVAGFERYFQIAKCFRDEDTRGDRQPEFTQLDVEMSFVDEEDVLALIEELVVSVVSALYPEKKFTTPFPRISYAEAMEKYTSDRPDLRKDSKNKDELAFLFVVDFPMFEWKESEWRWDAVHHPFTKVKRGKGTEKSNEEFLRKNPEKLIAHQYDLVLNGFEVGGGSLREYNPHTLKEVFKVMGHSEKAVEEQFGHLLEAFRYGAPPHGGMALGLDRLLAILAGEENIREVIAFPKTGDGRDLMMGAPAEVGTDQLKELGIKIEKKKK